MTQTSLSRSTGFRILALASLYLLMGWAVRHLAQPTTFGTLVWLPAGLALAAILILGFRVWPGVALGSFLTTWFLFADPTGPPWTSLAVGLGASLQAVAGAWLVSRFRGPGRGLDTPREIQSLVLLGAAGSCLINSTLASLLLWSQGQVPGGQALSTWFSWWIGDAVGVLILTPPLLLLDPALPRGRDRLLRVAWPVALAFTLVVLISLHVRYLEDRAEQQDFRSSAAAGLRVLDWEFQNSLEALDDVERLVASSQTVTSDEFRRFVGPALERDPALETLDLAALVPESQRRDFESRWFPITELTPEGRLRPAARRPLFAPLVYVEPAVANETFLGMDFASEALRREAVHQSLASRATVATAPLRLLLGRRGILGYVAFRPIEVGGQARFLALASFDLSRLFGPPLNRAGLSWMGVRVYDLGPAGEERTLVFDRPAEREGQFTRTMQIQRANRRWEVVFSGASPKAARSAGRWGVLAGGPLFTGILGAFMLLVTGQASRTEQLVLERTSEVRRLARRTVLVLDSAGEGICGLDLEGRASFVNPEAARLAGRPAADLLDRDLHAGLHPPDLCPGQGCPILSCLREGRLHSGSALTFQNLDGERFPVDCVAAPIREDGELVGAVVVFRDIRERLAADRMKSEFVSVVSHELRTPLTAIRGSLGLVASGKMGSLTPPVEKMVALAMRNVDRLGLLIDDILSLEAMESRTLCLEIEECPARRLLERALEENAPLAERASVTLELDRAEGQVRADPQRVHQVLTNLIGNAVKFSPAGAPITLAAIPVGPDGEVRFEVRDRGRGIPADFLPHLFERFRQVDSSDTREKGGTGLGLAICRNLVLAHGGRIWAESVEGQGSTFAFTLPAAGS